MSGASSPELRNGASDVRRRIVFLTGGDQCRLTGGNLYNRRVLDALRTSSALVADVEILVWSNPPLPAGRGRPRAGEGSSALDQRPIRDIATLRVELARLDPALLIVDSIALRLASQLCSWAHDELGAAILTLMHMLPSALVEAERETTVRGAMSGELDESTADLRADERRLLQTSDRIIAVSPSLRDQLIEAGAPIERIDVVPPSWDGHPAGSSGNGPMMTRTQVGHLEHIRLDRHEHPLYSNRFSPGGRMGRGCADAAPESRLSPQRRGKGSGDRGGIHCLTVANWSPAKGVHRVVEALATLRRRGVPANLDLVGDPGQPEDTATVLDAIRRGGLADDVRVHGAVQPNCLAEHYESADVFVLPSRSEGFGTVFVEAMSYGLPVIAESVGPLPALVGVDRGVLVPPGDDAALAEAMISLALDPIRRVALGRSGRAYVRGLPTWADTMARVVQIVQSTIQAGPGGGDSRRRAPRGEARTECRRRLPTANSFQVDECATDREAEAWRSRRGTAVSR